MILNVVRLLKNYPIKMLRGTKVEVNENKYITTPGLQKVFTNQSYDGAKSMNNTEKLVFRDILQKTGYYNRKPTKSCKSGCKRYSQNDLDNDVIRIFNLDTKLKGKAIEKTIIPSNIIDI